MIPPEVEVYPRHNADKHAARLAASRSKLVESGFPIYIRFGDLEAAGIAKTGQRSHV